MLAKPSITRLTTVMATLFSTNASRTAMETPSPMTAIWPRRPATIVISTVFRTSVTPIVMAMRFRTFVRFSSDPMSTAMETRYPMSASFPPVQPRTAMKTVFRTNAKP